MTNYLQQRAERTIALDKKYNALLAEQMRRAWANGYKPVNKHMVHKWIKALRSGKYVQASMKLAYQSGIAAITDKPITSKTCSFCATGVLCDLINSQAWFNYAVVYAEHSYVLRKLQAASWFAPIGLQNKRTIHGPGRYGIMDKNTANLPYGVGEQLRTLHISADAIVRMNDSGSTFSKIADYLERAVS
jgi:hypothetical protein